jgi:N utilization substance protein B
MGRRSKARECAFQLLYQHELTGEAMAQVVEGFWRIRHTTEPARRLAESLAQGAQARLAELDAGIARHAEHWRLDRIATIERTILRLAAYELLHTDTPAAVVIDEAVELAKRFGEAESPSFVNGILDALMRSAGRAAAAAPAAAPGKGATHD